MNKQSIYKVRCIINKLESDGIDVNSYNCRLTDCIKFNNVESFLGLLDELEFEERKVRVNDLFKYITIKASKNLLSDEVINGINTIRCEIDSLKLNKEFEKNFYLLVFRVIKKEIFEFGYSKLLNTIKNNYKERAILATIIRDEVRAASGNNTDISNRLLEIRALGISQDEVENYLLMLLVAHEENIDVSVLVEKYLKSIVSNVQKNQSDEEKKDKEITSLEKEEDKLLDKKKKDDSNLRRWIARGLATVAVYCGIGVGSVKLAHLISPTLYKSTKVTCDTMGGKKSEEGYYRVNNPRTKVSVYGREITDEAYIEHVDYDVFIIDSNTIIDQLMDLYNENYDAFKEFVTEQASYKENSSIIPDHKVREAIDLDKLFVEFEYFCNIDLNDSKHPINVISLIGVFILVGALCAYLDNKVSNKGFGMVELFEGLCYKKLPLESIKDRIELQKLARKLYPLIKEFNEMVENNAELREEFIQNYMNLTKTVSAEKIDPQLTGVYKKINTRK